MMLKDGKENFLKAHYDWIVAGVGILALAAAGAFCFLGGAGGEADEECDADISWAQPKDLGVAAVDMAAFNSATGALRNADRRAEVPVPSDKRESFLASERRIRCACGRVVPAGARAYPECPFCHVKPEAEKVVVRDTDKDGLPDEWEKKYGLDMNDAGDVGLDKDGDGFTNAQEFAAKTDPTDPKDHPDYMDFFKLAMPVRQTYMPIVFRKANQIPNGWRLEFFDPKRKDDYNRMGATLTAVIGEPIGDTGYTVKSYAPKSVKQKIAGTEGLTKSVDVSEAVVVRKRDGKEITLRIQNLKKPKFEAVDVEATVLFTLNGSKSFNVVTGSEFQLFGLTFKVLSIETAGKGAKVVLEETLSGKRRTLSALE